MLRDPQKFASFRSFHRAGRHPLHIRTNLEDVFYLPGTVVRSTPEILSHESIDYKVLYPTCPLHPSRQRLLLPRKTFSIPPSIEATAGLPCFHLQRKKGRRCTVSKRGALAVASKTVPWVMAR